MLLCYVNKHDLLSAGTRYRSRGWLSFLLCLCGITQAEPVWHVATTQWAATPTILQSSWRICDTERRLVFLVLKQLTESKLFRGGKAGSNEWPSSQNSWLLFPYLAALLSLRPLLCCHKHFHRVFLFLSYFHVNLVFCKAKTCCESHLKFSYTVCVSITGIKIARFIEATTQDHKTHCFMWGQRSLLS